MIPPALALAALAFDPIAFFRGKTAGEGVLKVMLKAPQTIRVESVGEAGKDGTLTLRQLIHEPGKPARTRVWKLRQTAPGKFAGTMTDAKGPVRIEQNGDAIRIRYKSKDGLDFDQTLTPTNPRAVANHMRIRRFGLTVAHIDEVIRKLD